MRACVCAAARVCACTFLPYMNVACVLDLFEIYYSIRICCDYNITSRYFEINFVLFAVFTLKNVGLMATSVEQATGDIT